MTNDLNGLPEVSKIPIFGIVPPTNVIPKFIGQEYYDLKLGVLYKAMGIDGSWNWVVIGKGGLFPFNKDSVAGLFAWYKANEGVTYDGSDLVSQWNDQSDSGKHLTQATANNKPLYIEDLLNGYPGIQFDGINDWIAHSSFVLSQPFTIIMALKIITIDGTENIFCADNGSSPYAEINLSDQWRIYGGGILNNGSVTAVNVIATFVFDGANSSIQINDNSPTIGNASTADFSYLVLGCYSTSATYPTNMNLFEALFFSGALSDENKALVRAYLNNKYAIY